MSVIVYGPRMCGKTKNSAVIAAHFGCAQVVDDWAPGDALPDNALALTDVQGVEGAIEYSSLGVIVDLQV